MSLYKCMLLFDYLLSILNTYFEFKLAISQKHFQRCLQADEHYRLNAQRIKARYNSKRVQMFEKGDIVSVRISPPSPLCCCRETGN